jgi:hypothetical protein
MSNSILSIMTTIPQRNKCHHCVLTHAIAIGRRRQGYPQIISAKASIDSRGIGVTVQDVLRTIDEDNDALPWTRITVSELGVEECGWD